MKRLIVALILGAGGVASAGASAQQSMLANVVAALPTAVDFPGSDATSRAVGTTNCDESTDAAPPATVANPSGGEDATAASTARTASPSGGAGTQAVSAPHRPAYRWQSLVPGAIK